MTQPTRGEPIRSQFADDDDMRELVELYVGDMPDRVRQLESRWNAAEGEQVRRIAHQLKGASAGYGFPSIGEAARALEEALKDDPDQLERVADQFNSLINECSRVSL